MAKMLKGATDDLWKYHEEAVAGKGSEKSNLEALSIAIARVQFTQVYLEDATVPLPTEEGEPEEVTEEKALEPEIKGTLPASVTNEKEESGNPPDEVNTSSSSSEPTVPQPPSKSRPKKSSISASEKPDVDIPKDFQTPRPSLTQSSFSWMLGQDQTTSSFVQAKSLPPSEHRRQTRGFLFGDDEPSSASGGAPDSPVKGKGGNKLRKKRPEGTSKAVEVLFEQEPEEWDLGKLEEEKLREKEENEKKEREENAKKEKKEKA